MGLAIVTKRQLRYLLMGLFIMLLYSACVSYPLIDYEPLNLEGKRQYAPNNDIVSYEELTNKGSVFYVEFQRFNNRKYSQIAIYLYTLDKHKTIKIHDLEFEFEDKVEIVRVNNTIKLIETDLNQEPRLFMVEDNDELKVEVFLEYILFEYNSVKIDMQRVFKKKYEDIGKEIELTLRVNYSFDGGEVRTQEIKYLVYIFEA